jgi:hypothetical protein
MCVYIAESKEVKTGCNTAEPSKMAMAQKELFCQ